MIEHEFTTPRAHEATLTSELGKRLEKNLENNKSKKKFCIAIMKRIGVVWTNDQVVTS